MKTIVSKIPSRRAFLKGQETLEIGYPWLSFGAIIALEAIVNQNQRVLEFGSGGSTLFWARNCQSVKAFETNPEWHQKVLKRLKKYQNAQVILADETAILEAITKEPDQHYDLVLVDSYPKEAKRILLANAVIPKIKPKGWLIIDNYQKFGMEDFVFPKGEIYTFDEWRYSGRGTKICQID